MLAGRPNIVIPSYKEIDVAIQSSTKLPIVIVPASGVGSRFKQVGYSEPKPFIVARNTKRTLIEEALLPFAGLRKIVLLRNVDYDAHRMMDGVFFYGMAQVQEGAALTVLAALPWMRDEDEVIVINSDQVFSKRSIEEWLRHLQNTQPDGSILTFTPPTANDARWSYVRCAPYDTHLVTEVAEKVVISTHATCGAYYFRSWKALRTAICRMIAENERYNGEFYLAPVYNQLIRSGLTVRRFHVAQDEFASLGTPELLEAFEAGLGMNV